MLGISVPTSIIECSVISTLLPISLSLSKLGLMSLIHSCREREREREKERVRVRTSTCVCVCVRERERERESQ